MQFSGLCYLQQNLFIDSAATKNDRLYAHLHKDGRTWVKKGKIENLLGMEGNAGYSEARLWPW
jgi:hypothetical protein